MDARMQSNQSASIAHRQRPIALWAMVVLLLLLCAIFPPVRFRKYRMTANSSAAGTQALQPAAIAEQFWIDRLLPAAQRSPDAPTVLAAMRSNPAAARTQYARTPAVGGPSYFLMTGHGQIISKNPREIGISLADGPSPDASPDLVISTGPLFGNAVRDGTGLLKPDDFPNSADYNALSSELNMLVKTRVLAPLKKRAQVEAKIHFSGVAQESEDGSASLPLQLVPISAEVQ